MTSRNRGCLSNLPFPVWACRRARSFFYTTCSGIAGTTLGAGLIELWSDSRRHRFPTSRAFAVASMTPVSARRLLVLHGDAPTFALTRTYWSATRYLDWSFRIEYERTDDAAGCPSVTPLCLADSSCIPVRVRLIIARIAHSPRTCINFLRKRYTESDEQNDPVPTTQLQVLTHTDAMLQL